MAASKDREWFCNNCGYTYRVMKPFGVCRNCKEMSSYTEKQQQVADTKTVGLKTSGAIKPSKPASTIKQLSKTPIKRTTTGINELDRVLGGGFVDAEVILLSGSPGAGKSSLSLAIADRFASLGQTVLYSSGEESEQQIGLRAKRLKVDNDNIKIINETSLENLLGHIDAENPSLVIVDSLQTLASSAVKGSLGSVAQSKESAHALTGIAKQRGISMVLISQVVKSGDFSGSESIQHIVDATLMLESDKDSPLKFLRATKNRFGDTTEVGVFQHTETGLTEVSDPSGVLVDDDDNLELSGTALSFISEGVRQIPVEIQALVAETTAANPRRQFTGVSYNRGQIVCAILDKFCNTKLYDHDVFVNTISGLRVSDPLADLGCAGAIFSSAFNRRCRKLTMFAGELSLTGQVRGSFMMESKIREAQRLGFERIVIPKGALNSVHIKKPKIEICSISSVKELGKFIVK